MAIESLNMRPDLSAGAVTDLAGLNNLKAEAARGSPAALEAVARQFEALFLGMMLDSMRSATIDGGLDDSSETQLYQQLFDRQVASNLSEGGGLGLARMLVEQLSAAGQQPAEPGPSGPAAGGASTGETPPAAAPGTAPQASPGQFIRNVLPHAKRAAAELGVHPMALVAQAALETGWGGRLARSADGASSYNLFGIKAGAGWQGRSATARTLEFEDGLPVPRQERFRSYDSIAQAFADYVELIKTNPRYAGARAAGADPARYAEALQQAGYATDPAYAGKIRAILDSAPMSEARQLLAADGAGGST